MKSTNARHKTVNTELQPCLHMYPTHVCSAKKSTQLKHKRFTQFWTSHMATFPPAASSSQWEMNHCGAWGFFASSSTIEQFSAWGDSRLPSRTSGRAVCSGKVETDRDSLLSEKDSCSIVHVSKYVGNAKLPLFSWIGRKLKTACHPSPIPLRRSPVRSAPR